MPRNVVTVYSRTNDFNSEGFYVNDKNIFMSTFCDESLEFERRDSVIKHICNESQAWEIERAIDAAVIGEKIAHTGEES